MSERDIWLLLIPAVLMLLALSFRLGYEYARWVDRHRTPPPPPLSCSGNLAIVTASRPCR